MRRAEGSHIGKRILRGRLRPHGQRPLWLVSAQRRAYGLLRQGAAGWHGPVNRAGQLLGLQHQRCGLDLYQRGAESSHRAHQHRAVGRVDHADAKKSLLDEDQPEASTSANLTITATAGPVTHKATLSLTVQ